jgi:hypothetical protein
MNHQATKTKSEIKNRGKTACTRWVKAFAGGKK